MDRYKLAIIGGDGIGPEVIAAALTVLDACEQRFGFETEREQIGWSSARYLENGERVTSSIMFS